MITISKKSSGSFVIGPNTFTAGDVKANFSPNAGKIKLIDRNTGAVILNNIKYSSIKSPDTSVAFADFATMKAWFENNVLASGGVTSAPVIMSATTSATGATYVAFASQKANKLVISNNTGTPIEFRRGGAGSAFVIPSGQLYEIDGITNADQIEIRRADTTNTQVTVGAEAKQF